MTTLIKKVPSGISDLDRIIDGGFPTGRSYLISGEPGTGKTMLSFQFLLDGLNNGENCIYVTLDESPGHIISDIQNLGWNITPFLENKKLQFLDMTQYFSSLTFNESNSNALENVINDISNIVSQNNATRLVIDPVSPLVFTEKKNT